MMNRKAQQMTGHLRQRSPSSWEIRYPVHDAATGKRRVITHTVKGDRKAAEKELRRLLHAVDEGLHVDPSKLTVGQWLQTWLDTIRVEKSRRTHNTYSSVVGHHLAPNVGHIALGRLMPIDVQNLYN